MSTFMRDIIWRHQFDKNETAEWRVNCASVAILLFFMEGKLSLVS